MSFDDEHGTGVKKGAKNKALAKKRGINDSYRKGFRKNKKMLELLTIDNRKNKGRYGSDRLPATKVHMTRQGEQNREHL